LLARRIYLEYANECFFGNNQCYQDDTALANATVFERGDPYRLNFGLPSPPNASSLISHFNPRMYAYTALRLAQLAGGGGATAEEAAVPPRLRVQEERQRQRARERSDEVARAQPRRARRDTPVG
jgi:hypothetical protein